MDKGRERHFLKDGEMDGSIWRVLSFVGIGETTVRHHWPPTSMALLQTAAIHRQRQAHQACPTVKTGKDGCHQHHWWAVNWCALRVTGILCDTIY